MELELGLDPDDAARLTRLALLVPLKSGRARSRAVRIVWHDSPDRALAQQGLALAEQRPQWRLERLYPGTANWPPGAPAPVLATASDRGRARPGDCPTRWCRWPRSRAASSSSEPGDGAGPDRHDPAERRGPGVHRRAPQSAGVRLEGAAAAGAGTGDRTGRRASPRGAACQSGRRSIGDCLRHARRRRDGRARPNCPRGCRWPRRSPMRSVTCAT